MQWKIPIAFANMHVQILFYINICFPQCLNTVEQKTKAASLWCQNDNMTAGKWWSMRQRYAQGIVLVWKNPSTVPSRLQLPPIHVAITPVSTVINLSSLQFRVESDAR